MEDGLVHVTFERHKFNETQVLILVLMEDGLVLLQSLMTLQWNIPLVLILVLMEDGLVLQGWNDEWVAALIVLILVLMEDGLVPRIQV